MIGFDSGGGKAQESVSVFVKHGVVVTVRGYDLAVVYSFHGTRL